MIYMRGQAADYDGWRQLGLEGWAWDDVLPYFKKHEDHHAGANALHGAGGEWRVERPRISWPILDAVREAAAEVGIPKVSDFNRGDNEGSDYFEVNQKRGRRWSAARGFLKPVLSRPNLELVTDAHVERLVVEDGRAVAVSYIRDGVQVSRRAPTARSSWRRARSARRNCSNSPASAGPDAWRKIGRSVDRTNCRASARICRIICNCARSSK